MHSGALLYGESHAGYAVPGAGSYNPEGVFNQLGFPQQYLHPYDSIALSHYETVQGPLGVQNPRQTSVTNRYNPYTANPASLQHQFPGFNQQPYNLVYDNNFQPTQPFSASTPVTAPYVHEASPEGQYTAPIMSSSPPLTSGGRPSSEAEYYSPSAFSTRTPLDDVKAKVRQKLPGEWKQIRPKRNASKSSDGKYYCKWQGCKDIVAKEGVERQSEWK